MPVVHTSCVGALRMPRYSELPDLPNDCLVHSVNISKFSSALVPLSMSHCACVLPCASFVVMPSCCQLPSRRHDMLCYAPQFGTSGRAKCSMHGHTARAPHAHRAPPVFLNWQSLTLLPLPNLADLAQATHRTQLCSLVMCLCTLNPLAFKLFSCSLSTMR